MSLSTLEPRVEREIEQHLADQIATGEMGPEPSIPHRAAVSVKQMDELVLPTPETAVMEDRDGFPTALPGIPVDDEYTEYEKFAKRAHVLGIEGF